MSNRRVLWLLILLILGLGTLLYTSESSNPVARQSGSARLLSLYDSRTVLLERRGQGRIRLEKSDDWQLREPFVARADSARVARLIDGLAGVTVLDYLSEDTLQREGRTLADFALDKPVFTAQCSCPEGVTTIALGRPTPAADGVYATLGEPAGVFVLKSEILNVIDLGVDELRQRSLYRHGPESVAAFDLRSGAGTRLSFERTGDNWTLNGERAASPNVHKFLETLTTAKALNFVWPLGVTNEAAEASSALLAGYGLDPESATTVTLKGVDGSDQVITLGKNAEAGQVYALVENGSAIVTVSAALKSAAVADARMFTDSRLFPVKASEVAYFTVKDGETVYALARRDESAWRLESPVTAAADASAVQELLAKILKLSPADIDPMGLAVSLSTNAPAFSVERRRLVDFMGFEDLRSREVLSLKAMEVKRLVRNDGRTPPVAVVYARDRQAWNLDEMSGEGRVDEAGIATILKELSPLMAERVERLKVSTTDLDDYGLNTPVLTLSIDLAGADTVRRNLIIGGPTEGGRFATLGSADAVFVLSDSVVEKLSTLPVKKE